MSNKSDHAVAQEEMLAAQEARNYEDAALAAMRVADVAARWSPRESAVWVQRAQAYAILHQSSTALWIAENRQQITPQPGY
ncbi:hypothetical protein FDI14_gp039 [Mycobacterium phage SirDuracell]|uniref:Uncharacterized protein n=3 Tax=Caudoviricetes TaxID=2731619 RepID=G1D5Q4_9CAUD|nr:hypothetical protein SEA_MINDY_41 [Mycobacterium phage Mindy]YP_009607969.1 hypothetical protein FDI14_gp039 [Mycobacterium phage SirDuracell]AEK10104.1 hypothetical protein PBI_SIRDURACELL_39 [Mycobacterium phage SirDuracell]AKF15071.1 hypothetical protein SEA_MINDY_41 [Mycobacterium phage Mindy]